MASMSAAMLLDGLYPNSTTASSVLTGTAAAACTPLGDGGVLVMKRLSRTSTTSAGNVPSVKIRNSEFVAPAIELPTESPIRATDDVTLSRVMMRTLNPGDGKPWVPRKSQAGMRRVPAVPARTMSLNQIPSNCWLTVDAASTIVAPVNVPRPYWAASVSASRILVQRWLGLLAVASPGSSTGGNAPPAVRGPFDAENSVDTMAPLGQTRTTPAVARIAWSVR